MPDTTPRDDQISVAEAFGRLPLETPERSAWPLLERRIAAAQPARPRPRWPFALAAAATLAVAALMPRLMSPTTAPPTDPVAGTPATPTAPIPLESLMIESARLETLISAVADDQMASASTTLLGLEFEDRLRQLDVALSSPTLDPQDRQQLWQQRVNLLRDYAGLQGTAQWLATDGETLDGALVATF